MLVIYRAQGVPDAEGHVRLEPDILGPNDPIPNDALWIDMVEPTPKEDGKVEQHLGVSIPTREDMSDIEPSELLYTENNVRYMTMRLFHNVEGDLPEIAGVGFILRDNVLVTVRYVRPLAFQMFANRCARGQVPTPEAILAGLIEAIIDRAADVLQASGERIDAVFLERGDLPQQMERDRCKRQQGQRISADEPDRPCPAQHRHRVEPADTRANVPAERERGGADADHGIVLAILQGVDRVVGHAPGPASGVERSKGGKAVKTRGFDPADRSAPGEDEAKPSLRPAGDALHEGIGGDERKATERDDLRFPAQLKQDNEADCA